MQLILNGFVSAEPRSPAPRPIPTSSHVGHQTPSSLSRCPNDLWASTRSLSTARTGTWRGQTRSQASSENTGHMPTSPALLISLYSTSTRSGMRRVMYSYDTRLLRLFIKYWLMEFRISVGRDCIEGRNSLGGNLLSVYTTKHMPIVVPARTYHCTVPGRARRWSCTRMIHYLLDLIRTCLLEIRSDGLSDLRLTEMHPVGTKLKVTRSERLVIWLFVHTHICTIALLSLLTIIVQHTLSSSDQYLSGKYNFICCQQCRQRKHGK